MVAQAYGGSGSLGLGILLVVWVLLGLIPSFICGSVWHNKGGSYGIGFALSFFLGVIGWLIVGIGHPSRTTENDRRDQRKCPSCAEYVRTEAVVCRFCGRKLPRLRPEGRDKRADVTEEEYLTADEVEIADGFEIPSDAVAWDPRTGPPPGDVDRG